MLRFTAWLRESWAWDCLLSLCGFIKAGLRCVVGDGPELAPNELWRAVSGQRSSSSPAVLQNQLGCHGFYAMPTSARLSQASSPV